MRTVVVVLVRPDAVPVRERPVHPTTLGRHRSCLGRATPLRGDGDPGGGTGRKRQHGAHVDLTEHVRVGTVLGAGSVQEVGVPQDR